jgi:hypothetical protein
MNERKPIPFDREAIRASWNAIFEEPESKKAKPAPAVKVVSVAKPAIEVVRKATQRSVEQLAEREKEEAAQARAERRAKEEIRTRYQAALDAQACRNLAEQEISRAWDPQGLWGPMSLASKLD